MSANTWIGIDWADEKHAFALQHEEIIEPGILHHSAETIEAWVQKLRKRFPGGKIAIVLEQSKGGLIFALMKYSFLELYPINPSTLAKYRAAWSPSRAKDDPTDAGFLLEIGVKHHDKLTLWKPESGETLLLQRLTEQRVRLVSDLKRTGNKLTSTLKEYFPQALALFGKIYRNVVADFILLYPSLQEAQKASDMELLSFFRSHSSGTIDRMKSKVALLRNALPLTTEPSVVESNKLFVKALALQLKALNQAISEYDSQIEALYEKHPDREIIESLPGAGPIMGPRLIAALGTNRARFASASELSCFTGISPVIEESGNQSWTHWRFFCNKHIRQAFVDWAFLSLRESFWAEAFYKSQRAKGKSHPLAVRALAFKWQRIIFQMWKNKSKYCEADYLRALKKAGSPLCRALVA